jgi:hypothetical protein
MEHATKRGPGRTHKDGTFRGGKAKKTNFAAALMAHWAKKRADSKAHKAKHPQRDKHGVYTRIGCGERIWRAGISAQRGY